MEEPAVADGQARILYGGHLDVKCCDDHFFLLTISLMVGSGTRLFMMSLSPLLLMSIYLVWLFHVGFCLWLVDMMRRSSSMRSWYPSHSALLSCCWM